MSILPTQLSLFNFDKVNSVLHAMTPLTTLQAATLAGRFNIFVSFYNLP